MCGGCGGSKCVFANNPVRKLKRAPSLGEREEGRRVIVDECAEVGVMDAQEGLDLSRGAVAETNPYDLGWSSEQKAPLPEVAVLRDDHGVVLESVRPHDIVAGALEADIAHVQQVGKEVREVANQQRG